MGESEAAEEPEQRVGDEATVHLYDVVPAVSTKPDPAGLRRRRGQRSGPGTGTRDHRHSQDGAVADTGQGRAGPDFGLSYAAEAAKGVGRHGHLELDLGAR